MCEWDVRLGCARGTGSGVPQQLGFEMVSSVATAGTVIVVVWGAGWWGMTAAHPGRRVRVAIWHTATGTTRFTFTSSSDTSSPASVFQPTLTA